MKNLNNNSLISKNVHCNFCSSNECEDCACYSSYSEDCSKDDSPSTCGGPFNSIREYEEENEDSFSHGWF
ncbi:MAG: hypothetical protein MJ246_01015 [Clostridia bacterium]|nr:hypothetical protein [Clostridia bacterium]